MKTVLDQLESIEGYRKHFMDLAVWMPYVRRVCTEMGEQIDTQVRPGLAGTYPTFIVGQRWVVKFFGSLFDGIESHRIEKIVTGLVTRYEPFPCPSILAEGELYPGDNNSWLFLVFEYISGVSIGERIKDIPGSKKMQFAGWLGERVRRLHEIPVAELDINTFPNQKTIDDQDLTEIIQRHVQWGCLPNHLVDQIGTFLEATQDLKNSKKKPHLIHADITRDHILGEYTGNTWKTHAIIDFGDAMLGNLAYELVALHLDLFERDAQILREFLFGYGADRLTIDELPLAGLRAALLHRFSVLEFLDQEALTPANCPSLYDLAYKYWVIS